MLERLNNSLKHAKKKDRKGIKGQIARNRAKRDDWKRTLTELGFDLREARLDVKELVAEQGSIRGTVAEPVEAPSSSGDSGGGSGGGGEAGEAPGTAERIANAELVAQKATERAAADRADLDAARRNITDLTGPGDLGVGGANAWSAMLGTDVRAVGMGPATAAAGSRPRSPAAPPPSSSTCSRSFRRPAPTRSGWPPRSPRRSTRSRTARPRRRSSASARPVPPRHYLPRRPAAPGPRPQQPRRHHRRRHRPRARQLRLHPAGRPRPRRPSDDRYYGEDQRPGPYGNAAVASTFTVKGESAAAAALEVERLINDALEANPERPLWLEWRAENLTRAVYFPVRGYARAAPAYRPRPWAGSTRPLIGVAVTWPVAPLAEGLPMSIDETWEAPPDKEGGLINLLLNSSFEVGVSTAEQVAPYGEGSGLGSLSTTLNLGGGYGGKLLRATSGGTTNFGPYTGGQGVPVTAGKWYAISGKLVAASRGATRTGRRGVEWRRGDATVIAAANGPFVAPGNRSAFIARRRPAPPWPISRSTAAA